MHSNRLLYLFFAGGIYLHSFCGAFAATKYAAIVVDGLSGKVLHEQNADARRYPASMTKMMTAYMLFDALKKGRLKLTSRLKVSRHASQKSPSKLWLKPGSFITVRDAIRGLCVKSANDVAAVVGEALGGSEARFARLMTQKAKTLGMTKTVFKNASGLPNRQQVTTARDMAKLAHALYRDFPQYYHFFGERSFKYGKRRYRNTNRLLGRFRGLDGIKTGYIRDAGYNLAASGIRDGRRLFAVVMGGESSKDRNSRISALMNISFVRLARMSPIPRPARPHLGIIDPSATHYAQNRSPQKPAKKEPNKESLHAAPHLPRPLPQPERSPFLPSATYHAQSKSAVIAVSKTKIPLKPPTSLYGTHLLSSISQEKWAVQVGAFSRAEIARRMAQSAQKLLSALKFNAKINVQQPLLSTKQKFYRAQLQGLSRFDARKACKALFQKGIDCMVVKKNLN